MTESAIRAAKPKGKREKLLAIGVYPDVSLERAREKRDEARKQLADGIDPSARKRTEGLSQADTLAAIAAEWLAPAQEVLH